MANVVRKWSSKELVVVRMFSKQFSFFLFFSLLLAACKVDVKPPNVTVNSDLDNGGTLVTCSAELSASAGGAAVSGVEVPIVVKASGGVIPYQMVDTAIVFDAQTVIGRTYTNNGSAPISVVDTMVVKDNSGHVSQCNFLVTVNPENVVPSNLACTLVPSTATPAVNQVATFTATASGGVAPYAFSSFNGGLGAQITSPLAAISSTQARASASYPTAGLRSATVTLTDNAGSVVGCSTSVNVANAPAISVVASPATSVVFGSPITLTAMPSNFSATPTYTFTTTRSGVSISSTGAVATITSASAQSAFNVVVTATSGSQSASQTISLSFLNPTSLACSVTHPAGTYYVGDSVKFTVSASSGEAVEITSFSTTSDYSLVSFTANSRTLSYSLTGTKTVIVRARSVSTGALCQGGADMTDSVVMNAVQTPALTCTGYTVYNPSYRYEWFQAYATISGGTGVKYVDTIEITKNGNTFNAWDGQWINATSAWLNIFDNGTYQVKFLLKDTNGGMGSCSTSHIVWN